LFAIHFELMKLSFVALILSLQLCAMPASAQTPWPSYMTALEPDDSDSTVVAVLPSDSVVQPPDSSVPADKARWSGHWSGWACPGRQCDIKLVVEKITAQGATIVYARGTAALGQFSERIEAQFNADELQGTLSNGYRISFKMRPDGALMFLLLTNVKGQFAAGVLSQDAPPSAANMVKLTERIPTTFIEDGKPVSLEVVIFKPPGAGPFPLAVFHHGSTGRGDNPAAFTSTWTSPGLAKIFTAKGWLVAFPQRRGRGKSDGLYDEGFDLKRSGYTCQAALSLAGFERALVDTDVAMAHLLARPDVAGQQALVGGTSRGGILSVAYAGIHPERTLGVINFVGGWIGDGCSTATAINAASFKRGAPFRQPMLWLYGENDSFYKITHSRQNFDAFVAAGGLGSFTAFPFPTSEDGHGVHTRPDLWREAVDGYLQQLGHP
jgi:pimeloyl-ACP methyl ester carboxylesterase